MNRAFLFFVWLSSRISTTAVWVMLLGFASRPMQALAQQDVAAGERLARAHFEICNELDSVKRSELARATYAQDIRSVDPLFEAQGFTGMQTAVRQLHQMFPRVVLSISGQVRAHHDVVKFDYVLGESGKPPIATGVDILVLKEGLIHRIYTFPDR